MSDGSKKEISPDEFKKKKEPILLEIQDIPQDSELYEEKVVQRDAENFYLLVSIYGSILKKR